MDHAPGCEVHDKSGNQKEHIHADGTMLKRGNCGWVGSQPTIWIEASDRRLQMGGEHQQRSDASQSIKEMITN